MNDAVENTRANISNSHLRPSRRVAGSAEFASERNSKRARTEPPSDPQGAYVPEIPADKRNPE
jgi:hypothetical protein